MIRTRGRQRLLGRLASPKLAAWLIVVLILLTLLSVLLPQKSFLGEQFEQFVRDVPWLASLMGAMSLDRVFTGWPIVVVAVLLAANVVACSVLRIQARSRVPRVAVSRDASTAHLAENLSPEDFLDAAAVLLGSNRYTLLNQTPDGLVARAGGSGFLGSMLLHASLLVIILGGAATAVTSFRGEMAITDGQTVIDAADAYLNVANEPEIGEAFSGTQVTLESTEVRYDRGVVVSAIAKMRATEPSGRTVAKEVRVNHPLDAGGKAYLLQDSGYAASLVIGTPGVAPQPVVVRLAERTAHGWRDSLDLGVIDGRRVTLEMTATPVPLGDDQPVPPEEFELADPRLKVALVGDGAVLWAGELARGQTASAETGVTLKFEDLHLWNRFLVRGEPARWITYLGFWLAVSGSAWRFAVPERRVSVAVRGEDGALVASVSLRSRPWRGSKAAADELMTREILGLAAEGGPDDHT
jgi:hypothetical protein